MPKLKTHKGAARRFHITGTGKIERTKGGKSHLRRRKAPRAKRLYDVTVGISAADVKRLKRLLPYGLG